MEQKKYERLYEAIKTSIKWSTIFCAIFGLIMALFPTKIISQFTTDDMELINIGQSALRANGLSFFLFGYYTVYSSLFLSLGKAKKRLYPWSLQTGDLLCTCYSSCSNDLGDKWYSLRTADF